jgi:hypothetical protein
MNLKFYFLKPRLPRQRQYEAVRAAVVDNLPVVDVAEKYTYTSSTVYSLLRDAKAGKLKLFPLSPIGPTERRTPKVLQKIIIKKRKLNMSAQEITESLIATGETDISVSTVERILIDAHFPKLPRRKNSERGITVKNQLISKRATPLNFDNLKLFRFDCPIIGIFFFLPYIIESGIIDIIQKCRLPRSSAINAKQACISMLLLKLIGKEHLSHIKNHDHEPGFGVFAGLNVLPKDSYITTYSCRSSKKTLFDLQKKIVTHFHNTYPNFYQSNFINLDFHSIPHFGDQAEMENVWCGARGKTMRGTNTIFAQDSESNLISYTNADILRKDETKEILKFVKYWNSIKGSVKETLVFDCKLTKYSVLDELNKRGVKFITLRKRGEKLLSGIIEISNDKWQKLYLPIPKRKHKAVLVCETEVVLEKCKTKLRQIIIKNHGRANPTFIITNNYELSLKNILIVYAKRWHVENKLAELVSFFNLNALTSPLMIRIHFDILWTVVANILYYMFAQDLPRFEKARANSIFRKFIDMPGQIAYDGSSFTIKIRKRAHTPILLGVKKLQNGFTVPWLKNKLVKIEWTA